MPTTLCLPLLPHTYTLAGERSQNRALTSSTVNELFASSTDIYKSRTREMKSWLDHALTSKIFVVTPHLTHVTNALKSNFSKFKGCEVGWGVNFFRWEGVHFFAAETHPLKWVCDVVIFFSGVVPTLSPPLGLTHTKNKINIIFYFFVGQTARTRTHTQRKKFRVSLCRGWEIFFRRSRIFRFF
jgi:hypothetical protein